MLTQSPKSPVSSKPLLCPVHIVRVLVFLSCRTWVILWVSVQNNISGKKCERLVHRLLCLQILKSFAGYRQVNSGDSTRSFGVGKNVKINWIFNGEDSQIIVTFAETTNANRSSLSFHLPNVFVIPWNPEHDPGPISVLNLGRFVRYKVKKLVKVSLFTAQSGFDPNARVAIGWQNVGNLERCYLLKLFSSSRHYACPQSKVFRAQKNQHPHNPS